MVLATFLALWVWQAADQDPFSECLNMATAAKPWSVPDCLFQQAMKTGEWERAEGRLETMMNEGGSRGWPLFYQARIASQTGAKPASPLYRQAVAAFIEEGDYDGEVYARLNLYRGLLWEQRVEEAGAQLARAEAAAHHAHAPFLAEQVRVSRALYYLNTLGDLEEGARLLADIEKRVFPAGPYSLRRDTLLYLGNIHFQLGRFSRVEGYMTRLLDMAAPRGDRYLESTARFTLMNCLIARGIPTEEDRDRLLQMAREGLDAAVAGNHAVNEISIRTVLGIMSTGAEGADHLERAVARAREVGEPVRTSLALRKLAIRLVDQQPGRARKLMEEAFSLLNTDENPWPTVYALADRMTLQWKVLAPEQALSESLKALDLIESIRRPQATDTGRMDLFSVWTTAYTLLAGRLFRQGSHPSLAFAILERMRARTLLERLQMPVMGEPSRELQPLLETRARLQDDMTATHRLLFAGIGEAGERANLLSRLDDLERSLADNETRIVRMDPRHAEVSTEFAGLETVRDALGEDEALLSFQIRDEIDIMGEFEGGAWLQLVTRTGVRAFRLPDRFRLELAIETWLGLFQDETADVASASVSIYHRLLEAALNDLSPAIRKLIIIPDGPLHHLPLGALHAEPGGEPLAARFELFVVPSATLWLHWRRDPAHTGGAVLVMADPNWQYRATEENAGERGSGLFEGADLGPLPHARAEGRAVLARLEQRGRLLVGEAASEQALKTMDTGPYSVLHFAAHAVVDEHRPQRSAVLLFPGGPGEDGALQPREIAAMDLRGRVVVLSTCRSASGALIGGEGVLSLARAFMQAGAHAVVGTLWPLRDDRARWFFEDFYRHLVAGLSVSGSLQAAQLSRIKAGDPPAAWAGIGVVGRGNLTPFPGGLPPRRGKGFWVVGLLAVLGLCAWLAYRRPR